MKVYINIDDLSIVRIEREKPFYEGSNFIDRMRILFNRLDATFSPTAMFKLPTGRRVGPVHPIGIDEGTTRGVDEDGKLWYYYDFIISTEIGLLMHPGQLEASIVLNYYNSDGTIIKQAVVGTVINEVVKTTVFGEGNIIVVGEDPEVILNNFNSTIANLANRQSTIEATWTNVVSKLVPVVKNLLVNSKDTYIKFCDDSIKIVHLGETILEISEDSGLIIKTRGLIIDGNSRLKDVTFENAHGENIIADDIRSLDGHIDDNLYVGSEIYLGETEVKTNIVSIRSTLSRLVRIIEDQLEEEDASIRFNDNSIIIEHKGQEIMRISSDDGVYFYDTVEFREAIEAKQDIFLNGESLAGSLDVLRASYEEAKTYTYRKIEQEIKDRNAAIETLKESLLDGAPQALDTLLELAKALGNDPNFATSITNLINQKFNDSKNYTDSNFLRSEDFFSLVSHLEESDLENVFKGVYE